MKRLKVNHLGKKHLDQYSKITVKSLFEEIENQVKRNSKTKIRLNRNRVYKSQLWMI